MTSDGSDNVRCAITELEQNQSGEGVHEIMWDGMRKDVLEHMRDMVVDFVKDVLLEPDHGKDVDMGSEDMVLVYQTTLPMSLTTSEGG